MRFLKFLLLLIIVGLLVGGAFYASQLGWNWQNLAMYISNWSNGGGGHTQQHAGMPEQAMASPFNTLAADNKDKLMQANTILNQAMELITTDPYSQITVPNRSEVAREAAPQGNVNVTPKDGTTININPGSPPQQLTAPDLSTVPNVVFDQTKLEQLHNGIFKFSQAMMLLQELNNDLADQSVMTEAEPPNQQTYVIRYNLTLQNRNKLNQANRMLQEAMILVNVNPYAPVNGYIYNAPKMQQLHQGIAELAKSALLLSRLSEDFNTQMVQIANDSRIAKMQPVQGMQHGNSMLPNNSSGLTTIGMVIAVFGVVLGILIMIKRLLNDFRMS